MRVFERWWRTRTCLAIGTLGAVACGPLDTADREKYRDPQGRGETSEALSAVTEGASGAEVLTVPSPVPLSSLTATSTSSTFYPPMEIDGVNAASTCIYAGEATPVRSHNATSGDVRAFVPFQNVFASDSGAPYPRAYNWAANWSSWSTQRGIPIVSGISGGADPWSTTSSHTGLEYASSIGSFKFLGVNFTCLLVGSTSWTNLQNGTWTNPLYCQLNHQAPDFDDGPSTFYDDTPGGYNLMGASWGTYEHLYIWPNCNGNPTATCGDPCGLCTFTDVTNNNGQKLAGGHPVVRAHSNHDVMVAFRTNAASPDGSGHIHLVFYTPSGTRINDWVYTQADKSLPRVSACQSPACSVTGGSASAVPKVGGCNSIDCDAPAGKTGHGGCMRISEKVYLATRYTGAHQYAYITYAITCGTGPDGGTHTKTFLDVADVTNPSAPTLLRSWNSSPCTTSNDNAFEPVFVAAENYDKFAWGFYHQSNANPADTRFVIYTATDPTLASWTGGVDVDSGFPTLIVDNVLSDNAGQVFDYGLGDYIGGADDAFGNLYFTYGRPVATTATTCPAPMNSPTVCGGQKYSVALYAAKVTP